jgi:nucleoside-diphosphate-sugar epimerase
MRLYGRLKLDDEAVFADWSRQRNKRAVIARVFNLSGPYINKQSSYALACFIADALAGRPIEIRATRPVLRSYVAISELMSVAFGALTDGEAGPILFDTAGDCLYEMAQIAEAVREVFGQQAGIRRLAMTDEAPDRYVGDGDIYRRLRSWLAVEPVDFISQIEDTARFMADPAPNPSAEAAPRGAGRNGV